MSKPGCPYDNSCMESFLASMKKEFLSRKEYATIDAVKQDVFYYIEMFYNRKRLHSALGYLSPVSYRLKNSKKPPGRRTVCCTGARKKKA
ncbi:MAG: IS3 family transposase [Clostridia bacterium]|nr:IS3 family transposase [Clostridia bacterium]